MVRMGNKNTLTSVVKLSLLLILFQAFSVSSVFAERLDIVPTSPIIGDYFKYRKSHGEIRKIRAVAVKHLQEVELLLQEFEEKPNNQKVDTKSKRTKSNSRLEGKILELESTQKEIKQLLSHRYKGKIASKFALSVERKLKKLSGKLSKIKNTSDKKQKRLAIRTLRKELKQIDKGQSYKAPKLEDAFQPNGMGMKPPLPLLPSPEFDSSLPNENPDLSFLNSNVQQLDLVPGTSKTVKPSIAIDILSSVVNFLIPVATAETYQAPEQPTDVIACYNSTTDYNDRKEADLDLSSSELEVDLGLNPDAYEAITQLASELEYDPVKIYEYVRNQIEHDHYAGSVKGALGVLNSEAANDVDHASLLIALLRASSIPSRYALGYVYVQDKSEHLDWWNVKTIEAANEVVAATGMPPTGITYTIEGKSSFAKKHVWVEACVPYSNYRGNEKGDTQGHRWISLDASFKTYDRLDGLEQNTEFDYDAFLSERTKTMPFEEYEKQVLTSVRATNSNVTLQDVGVRWTQKAISLEFLPDTLPYPVAQNLNWNSQIADSKTAVLPDAWKAKVRIYFANDASFDIPMNEFAQHRVSLSFEGISQLEKDTYLEFMDGSTGLDLEECGDNLNVRPVFKVDGIVIPNLSLSSTTICDNGSPRNIDMGVVARLEAIGGGNNAIITARAPNRDRLVFDTISPLDYYAITAYPFNGSERFIQQRTQRLIESINTIDKPSDNLDETIGEFLHIVLLKYMSYITRAEKDVGVLFGTSGRSGHHVGLTSTKADVSTSFDLPYALQSNNFVVDVPGGLSASRDVFTGDTNFEALKLTGYSASHYESYVWQETALKDAVSTVSGLQIASSTDNPVQSFESDSATASDNLIAATALENFVDICSSPSTPGNSTCYNQGTIDYIVTNKFKPGYINKVTIPERPVSYNNWIGPVFAAEAIAENGRSGEFGFPISSYSGGYTVPTPDPAVFLDYSNGSSSSSYSYSTGFDVPATVPSTTSDFSNDTVSVVNSGIGNGTSTYATTAFDPVNMVTGNMYHNETDIAAPARGFPIVFKRTYNSRNPVDGPLGWGWTHSLNQTLEFFDTDDNGETDTIKWTNGTGSEKFLLLDDESNLRTEGWLSFTEGQVAIPDGYYFKLYREVEVTCCITHPVYGVSTVPIVFPQDFILTEKDGTQYVFDSVTGDSGDVAKLKKIIDRDENELSFYYSDGKLISVIDDHLRSLSISYYLNTSYIHTITEDWSNTVHEYFYDEDGHLEAYRNPLDRAKDIDSSSYTYYSDSDGYNLEHRMKTFGYANGYEMTFEYYVNGKAYRHYNAKGETATFTYNDFRRESTTVDELGNVQRYTFNQHGLPVEITDTLGGKEIYTYEDENDPFLRTSVTNAMGYVTQYSYDDEGNLTSESMPSGATVEYSYYNNQGKPQVIKNALGNYVVQLYDYRDQLTDSVALKAGFGASIDPSTFVPQDNSSQILSWNHFEYDGNGKQTKTQRIKDFSDETSGPSTEHDYTDTENGTEGIVITSSTYNGDIDGDGIISTDEGLGTYTYHYDDRNQLTQGFNGALYPIEVKYDAAGRVVERTGGLGGTQTITHDASGLPIGQTLVANVNGQVVLADQSFTRYDLVGRPISSTDSSGAISNFEYDAAGNLKKVTSPDGYTVYFDYDAKNRVTKTYDEEGHTVERKLDLIGRVKQLIDPNGNITQYNYYGPSQNGRLESITDAEGRATTFEYNAAGQVTKVTDHANRETLSDYDELGRVIRVVNPVFTDVVLGSVRPVTTYRYNTLGFQTHVYAGYTNAAGDVAADNTSIEARYEYDDFGRLLKKYDAADNLWEITEYDVYGNVLSSRDPNGNVTTATYGYGGILESQTTAGSAGTETVSYTNNGIGQPTKITSNNVEYSYEYDTAHRLSKVTDSRGGLSVNYDYSIGGMLNSISDSNNKTSYLYDPVGRLTGVRTPGSGLISYVYDAGGRLQQKVFPNDLRTAYEYFNDNTVKSISTQNGAGDELVRQDYTYSASTGDTETALFTLNGVTQGRSYEYDGLGRLTKERDTTNSVDLDQLSYDPYGNRRQRTVGGVMQFYSHNNLHQISDIRQGSASGSVLASFTYDDNGNMTGKTDNGVTTTLAYDVFDRVVGISKDGLPAEIYTYDHSSRRIQTTIGSTALNYHYSGPDIIGEYGSDWTSPQATYAHGAAMDDPLVRIAANDPQYYHGDGLGSIVAMSDKLGTLTASNRYDAWGNVSASTGSTPQYGFTGREPSDTGLVYFRARYYDPQIGRFTGQDPKGFIDGINRYAYVMNNPVNYVDPWGTTASTFTNTFVGAAAYAGNPDPRMTGLLDQITPGASDIVDFNNGLQDTVNSFQENGLTWATAGSAAVTVFTLFPGKAEKLLPDVTKGPTLDVSRSATPGIAKNVENAISQGAPATLTREASKRQIRQNRRGALRGQQAAGPGKSLDEYPFASTKQGGSGACVSAVCAREQSVQGGQISQFYKKHNIKDGDSFNVRVVD